MRRSSSGQWGAAHSNVGSVLAASETNDTMGKGPTGHTDTFTPHSTAGPSNGPGSVTAGCPGEDGRSNSGD